MSTVTLDVDAVRARFSALKAPTAYFDAPGGTQVPGEPGGSMRPGGSPERMMEWDREERG